MKNLLLCLLVCGCSTPSEMDVYLLLGQSNMSGRGEVTDPGWHPRVWMLDADGDWVAARHPIHFDKPNAGVGPGMAFAEAMVDADPGVQIGLVPCGVGGSELSRWEPGGDLYSEAVRRAKIAARNGRLRGVIWHQGETDATDAGKAQTYGRRLESMIRSLRSDLDDPQLPFVAGELGAFLEYPCAETVNAALRELPHRVQHAECVSADGLADVGDGVHFNAESANELGKRYAEAMLRLR